MAYDTSETRPRGTREKLNFTNARTKEKKQTRKGIPLLDSTPNSPRYYGGGATGSETR